MKDLQFALLILHVFTKLLLSYYEVVIKDVFVLI